MGLRPGVMCKLFLGSIGLDHVLDSDTNMDFLLVCIDVDLSDDRVGHQEAQRIQTGIWRQIPQRQKGHLPIHCLIYLPVFHFIKSLLDSFIFFIFPAES